MMVVMNLFFQIVNCRNAFSFIFSRCQRFSPSQIKGPEAEFEHAQNLSSRIVDLSSAGVIATT